MKKRSRGKRSTLSCKKREALSAETHLGTDLHARYLPNILIRLYTAGRARRAGAFTTRRRHNSSLLRLRILPTVALAELPRGGRYVRVSRRTYQSLICADLTPVALRPAGGRRRSRVVSRKEYLTLTEYTRSFL